MALPLVRTSVDFANAVLALPRMQPVTDRFAAKWRAFGRSKQQERVAPWYRTDTDWLPGCSEQQRHWYGWIYKKCMEDAERGRKHRDPRVIYDNIRNPLMLVYMVESVLPKHADSVVMAALRHNNMPAMANAVRGIAPWPAMDAALGESVRTKSAVKEQAWDLLFDR